MMKPEEGYAKAQEILKQKFGKRSEVARSCIDALVKGGQIAAGDREGIIKLAEEMHKCSITLKELGYLSDLNSYQTLFAIMLRLPEFLQQKWEIRAAEIEDEQREPRFSDLLRFMQKRAAQLETSFARDRAMAKSEQKSTKKGINDEKKKPVSKTLATSSNETAPAQRRSDVAAGPTATTPSKKTCPICEEEHNAYHCDKFKAMTVDQRKKAVIDKRLCYNCLTANHRSRQCKSRVRCRECNRAHNTLLHSDEVDTAKGASKDKETSKPSSTATATTAVCAINKSAVSFPIVAVVVSANGKECRTYAVLDQCSDATLCTKRLLRRLSMTGRPSPFSVDTVNGRHVDHDSVVVQLEVDSLDRGNRFKLECVRSVENIPVTTRHLVSGDVAATYPHLSDVRLPTLGCDDVDLLIGSNNSAVFIVEEHRVGRRDEPYAQKYSLGWVVIGSTSGAAAAPPHTVNCLTEVSNEELSRQLSQMWKYDFSDNVSSAKTALSVDDRVAQKFVMDSIHKDKTDTC